MTFDGKRIIITGSSGVIGSNLVARLCAEACELVRISRTDKSSRIAGLARCTDVVGDIGDANLWRRVLPGAHTVFHLAAQTSVPRAEADPCEDERANVLPMRSLLEASREQTRPPMIVFAGSATQVGLPEMGPVNESTPDCPVTTYDWHKLAAERSLEEYARHGWARGVTLRLSNVYGPGPASSAPDRGILNQMMLRALTNQPLTLYGDGHQCRDYVFIADVIDALIAAAMHAETVNGAHFLVCTGRPSRLSDVFELVADRAALLTGKRATVHRAPPPSGLSSIESRSFWGDSSRFRRMTGWVPRTALPAGIDLTLQSIWAGLEARK